MMKKYINYFFLIVLALIFIFPFYWMFVTSFKSRFETLLFPPSFWPKEIHLENYAAAWNSGPFMTYLRNSIITTVSIALLQTLINVPAAYAFARYDFKGKNFLFGLIMVTLMIPTQLIFIPVYLQMSQFKMIDTLWALILPFAASAFGIFMLRQVFLQVPDDLIHAARLDHASEFQIMMKIMIPYAKPTIITFILFSFITHWNDYFWPLIMTTSNKSRTLPIGISALRNVEGGIAHNIVMAGNVILVFPLLIAFFFAQKQFMQAFTYSGNK